MGNSDLISLRVPITGTQLKAINDRMGLGPFSGKARAEYMVGLALGQPENEVLARARVVHAADVAERVRREPRF